MHLNLKLLNVVKEKLSIPYAPQTLKHLTHHAALQVQKIFDAPPPAPPCKTKN